MDKIPVKKWCSCLPRVWIGGPGGGGCGGGGISGSGDGTAAGNGNGIEKGTENKNEIEKGTEIGKEYPPRATKADILPLWVCRILGGIKG